MAFFQKSLSYLKTFDLFGVRPSFYFQGKLKSGTSFGFFLSLLLLIFTCICFGYFGQDLYYRLNPNLRYHAEFRSLPESITLDPEETPIIIELNSMIGDIFFTDPSLLSLKISQFSIRKILNETIVNSEYYPMEICTSKNMEKLDKKTQEYFLKKNLKDFFCVPPSLKNLTMQGAFDQEIFQAIVITVSICDNLTRSSDNLTINNCRPFEEIQSKLIRGYIGVYFIDYTIDPSDYLSPKKTQPKEVFTNFMVNSQKQMDIMMRNNYIKTEDGVIFQQKSEEKIVNFDASHEFDFKVENKDFFLIFFKVKQENAYYERNYRKLQDLLAQIGGFFNCFWIIAIAFNYLFSNLFIISEILINIFTIKIAIPEGKKREKKRENAIIYDDRGELLTIPMGKSQNISSFNSGIFCYKSPNIQIQRIKSNFHNEESEEKDNKENCEEKYRKYEEFEEKYLKEEFEKIEHKENCEEQYHKEIKEENNHSEIIEEKCPKDEFGRKNHLEKSEEKYHKEEFEKKNHKETHEKKYHEEINEKKYRKDIFEEKKLKNLIYSEDKMLENIENFNDFSSIKINEAPQIHQEKTHKEIKKKKYHKENYEGKTACKEEFLEKKLKDAISLEEIILENNDNFIDFSAIKIQEEELKDFELVETIDLGFLDYLHYYTGWFKSPERDRKKMIMDKGATILRTCLDIKYIIQKFYEIEKLKQMLLNDEELERFARLPKPELKFSIDENQKKKNKINIFSSLLAKRVSLKKEEKKKKIMIEVKNEKKLRKPKDCKIFREKSVFRSKIW